jgi:hypothetical protein
MMRRTHLVWWLLVVASLACGACAHTGGANDGVSGPAAPPVDSVTTALWRLDESGGTRVADAGPFRLEGVAGIETRTDFGRAGSARLFTHSLDSFILVPYNPVLENGGGLTVESWVRLNAYGDYEDTPIVGRWSEDANQQSWLLSIIGRRLTPPLAQLPSPGHHNSLVTQGPRGGVLFAYQPGEASAPRAFVSTQAIPLDRWTHIAATFDGSVVKIFIDGHLDAQYATRGTIRKSGAPLLFGNYFDTRRLSSFGGDLRLDTGGDPNAYYALTGALDEVRISSAARSDFPIVR